MTVSLYDTAFGTYRKMLHVMADLLRRGEAHAAARKFEPAVLLQARLAPDMFPLTRQVQIACDMAKSGGARLAGVEVPKHDDNETTFEELHARIAKVLAFLDTLDRSAVEAGGERTITVPLRDRSLEFRGGDFLVQWSLPNFFFHVTMVYALLRHNGVELGKNDFMGGSR